MTINAVDQIISDTDLIAIKKKINDARTLMPFLLSLSNKQRSAKYKLSSKRHDFVALTATACKVEPTIVPLWVNAQRLNNDLTLNNQLYGIETMLQSLLNDVKDTRMQAGSEALKAASDVYVNVLNAKDRLPGFHAIYDQLKDSFPGRGKNKAKKKDGNNIVD